MYCCTSERCGAGDPGVLPWVIQGFLSLHVVAAVRSSVEMEAFGGASGWGWDWSALLLSVAGNVFLVMAIEGKLVTSVRDECFR